MTSAPTSRDARSAAEWRMVFRTGVVRPTAGLSPGRVQANLVAVPRDWAWDMLLFAQRNPKACPVLDVVEPGSPASLLAAGADLRTDLPLYRIWRDGDLVAEAPDVVAAWREDLVAFLMPYAITHAPGHLLLTDVADSGYET